LRHSEIKEILNSHGIEAESITEVQVAKNNKIFRIDDRYLLRFKKAHKISMKSARKK
jgi:hypothetical protein